MNGQIPTILLNLKKKLLAFTGALNLKSKILMSTRTRKTSVMYLDCNCMQNSKFIAVCWDMGIWVIWVVIFGQRELFDNCLHCQIDDMCEASEKMRE